MTTISCKNDIINTKKHIPFPVKLEVVTNFHILHGTLCKSFNFWIFWFMLNRVLQYSSLFFTYLGRNMISGI